MLRLGQKKAEYRFSGRGEIYSFTTVYEAPAGFEEQAPYRVALVRLEEGPMLTAQLTDWGDEDPEIGTAVEMVVRRLGTEGDRDRGMIIYGYKFRPILRQQVNENQEGEKKGRKS